MKAAPAATARAETIAPETLPEWDLGTLYAGRDDPAIAADLKALEADIAAFAAAWRGRVAERLAAEGGPAALGEAVRAYEAIEDRLGRIGAYAGLLFAADNSDPRTAKFYGDTQQRVTDLSGALLFFTLELNRLDDAVLERAMAADAGLARYRPWLTDIRVFRPHQLADDFERYALDKSATGYGAWVRLFDETLSSLRFSIGGEDLSIEQALDRMSHRERPVREGAAREVSRVLEANARLFTHITNTLAKEKSIDDRWRSYRDVTAFRHLSNRVEAEVVDALTGAVRAAHPRLSHRYYAMKAKWLGLDQLAHFDRNAPLPVSDDARIPWEEAREIVLGAYGSFAPRMADIARDFFDRRWIDARPRPGKTSGAFSHPTTPSANPFILMTYQGRARDVMTLAHELGHGVHQVLAAEQGALMAATPLTLAETASVFGEMLTFRALLAREQDPVRRAALLAAKVEDMLNTVVRQIAFYSFERRLHESRREGELTADDIAQHWMETMGESLGPAFALDETYRHYWAYVPHFVHSPFYVYAYAFGDCLVNALYAVYEGASDGFAERYFAMLSAGGTRRHGEALAPFGLDARDPAFWSKGLDMIAGFIDELEGADLSGRAK